MISMTNLEMVKYMRDFASIRMLHYKKGDILLTDAFKEYKTLNNELEDINPDYYKTMSRVYDAYTVLRLFSYYEDFLLNKDDNVFNRDLKDFKHNCTFYERDNVNTKRIIQSVRNAFNHNNNGEFKVSKNGKNFEVDIPDVRTAREIRKGFKPRKLHMKFPIEYVEELHSLIARMSKTVLYSSFVVPDDFNIEAEDLNKELNKIRFQRFYFKRRLNEQEIELLRKLNDVYSPVYLSNCEEAMKIVNQIGYCSTQRLNQNQKNKIIQILSFYKKNNFDLAQDRNNILYYILPIVIPIPITKSKELKNENMLNRIILGSDCSYNTIGDAITDKVKSGENDRFIEMYRNIIEEDFMVGLPLVLYIDSVINHLCDDEEITIDGKTYKRSSIRNSLVHGRWIISSDEELILYDADPRNENDLRIREIGKINLVLFAKWANDYINEKENKQNNPYVPKLMV